MKIKGKFLVRQVSVGLRQSAVLHSRLYFRYCIFFLKVEWLRDLFSHLLFLIHVCYCVFFAYRVIGWRFFFTLPISHSFWSL